MVVPVNRSRHGRLARREKRLAPPWRHAVNIPPACTVPGGFFLYLAAVSARVGIYATYCGLTKAPPHKRHAEVQEPACVAARPEQPAGYGSGSC